MLKVKAVISYDGSKFFGSQIQKNLPTVHLGIKNALLALNIDTDIEFSGRTDKGVHALNQVVSFFIPQFWQNLDKLKEHINSKLDYIYFKQITFCHDSFSPRFDAKKRLYRYIISTKEKNPFLKDYVSFVKNIDQQKIIKAIKLFEGTHDFILFRKTKSDEKSTIRTIFKTKFYPFKDFYIFYFEGNSFLRSQIRMMVGTLLMFCDNKISLKDIQNQLNTKKSFNIKLAPPNGLYLSRVVF